MVKANEKQKRPMVKQAKPIKSGEKTTRPQKVLKPASSKNFKAADGEVKSKKIQKAPKTPNELQTHHQNIIMNIKKKNLNKEVLNKAIANFLAFFQKNATSLTGKTLGAKALQLCLKYGNNSHRETIVEALLKTDFVALCSSIYGGFIISKIFRYCDKVESIKAVHEFFKKSFRDLLKKKENLVALNAYMTSMDEKNALVYLEKELNMVKLDEFYFHEFIEYVGTKPSVMKLSIVYFMIHHYFDNIGEEQRVTLLALILKHVDEAINKSEHKYFVIIGILKIFMNVNFKNKKEIIKKFLKEEYLAYFVKHSAFVYLLVGLLKKISDQKVINITILKAFKSQFEIFFSSVEVAKLIELLFSDEIADKLQKDKFFKCNPIVKKILDIENIDKDPVFRANVHHIRAELASEQELLSYFSFDQIKNKSGENSTFSLLYSSLFEKMFKGKLTRSQSQTTN